MSEFSSFCDWSLILKNKLYDKAEKTHGHFCMQCVLTCHQALQPKQQLWEVMTANLLHSLAQQEMEMVPLMLQGCNYAVKFPASGAVSLLLLAFFQFRK